MSQKKKTSSFFETLYEEYEQKIYFCAYRILQQKEQAEDITHDVFIQLYKNEKNLEQLDELQLKKLILTITKNKAIDLYRKNTSNIRYLENYQEETSKIHNNVESHMNELISEEEFMEIAYQLKEPYLQVFIYRIFYELSTKEVATIMSVKEATIRKQFERAKEKIKYILGGFLNEEAK